MVLVVTIFVGLAPCPKYIHIYVYLYIQDITHQPLAYLSDHMWFLKIFAASMNLWEISKIFPFRGVNMPIFSRGYVLLLVLGSVYLQMQSLNLWGFKDVKDVDDKLHVFFATYWIPRNKTDIFSPLGGLDARAGSSTVLDRKIFPWRSWFICRGSSSSKLKVDKWD